MISLIRKEDEILERRQRKGEEQAFRGRKRVSSFYKNETKYLIRKRVGSCYKNKN